MNSSKSKFWTELRHGDEIILSRSDANAEFTKLRFECLWGKSKEPRNQGGAFMFVGNGPFLDELETSVLQKKSRSSQRTDNARKKNER